MSIESVHIRVIHRSLPESPNIFPDSAIYHPLNLFPKNTKPDFFFISFPRVHHLSRWRQHFPGTHHCHGKRHAFLWALTIIYQQNQSNVLFFAPNQSFAGSMVDPSFPSLSIAARFAQGREEKDERSGSCCGSRRERGAPRCPKLGTAKCWWNQWGVFQKGFSIEFLHGKYMKTLVMNEWIIDGLCAMWRFNRSCL